LTKEEIIDQIKMLMGSNELAWIQVRKLQDQIQKNLIEASELTKKLELFKK